MYCHTSSRTIGQAYT
ncbi:MAG: hypothetical protein ACI4F1_14420 [Bariatricus sp.]